MSQKEIKIVRKKIMATAAYLKKKRRILFLTTSNRWHGEQSGEEPKSTRLAREIAKRVGSKKVTMIDVTRLKIYPCEGNVSAIKGNVCGVSAAILKDKTKNPSGCHRCWASINNPDDELWRVSRALLKSDCVVFFGSVRWGQMNAYYQKLIERLTWLENRHSCLGEKNILAKIESGIIALGHNWHGKQVLQTQKQVLAFFGFKVAKPLCWHWQYAKDYQEENSPAYLKDTAVFEKILGKEK